jgi:hypothetical protein
MMEAGSSSEMLFSTDQTTLCNIPKDSDLRLKILHYLIVVLHVILHSDIDPVLTSAVIGTAF